MKKGIILLVEKPMKFSSNLYDNYNLQPGDTVNIIDDKIYFNRDNNTEEINLHSVTLSTSKELLEELFKLI